MSPLYPFSVVNASSITFCCVEARVCDKEPLVVNPANVVKAKPPVLARIAPFEIVSVAFSPTWNDIVVVAAVLVDDACNNVVPL